MAYVISSNVTSQYKLYQVVFPNKLQDQKRINLHSARKAPMYLRASPSHPPKLTHPVQTDFCAPQDSGLRAIKVNSPGILF